MGKNPEDHLDGCALDFKEHAVSDKQAQALVSKEEPEDEDTIDDDDGGSLDG